MKPRRMSPILVVAAALLAGCVSAKADKVAPGADSSPDSGKALSAEQISAINANCYEVVARKSTKDSLKYEKALNWDLVDFSTRNDEYISIGTAFAIGPNEFATASHVMLLTDDSLVYGQRFIRSKSWKDGKQISKVYEVDDIKAFHSSRDYVVFGVKDYQAATWFEIEKVPAFNKRIFTAGNAYGEGIVVREGVLLGEIPESENGEWQLLKSSIATNPGNSGGPLLNQDLKVIGIVLQKKDDFCYSLAMKDIIGGKAIIHIRNSFGFAAFSKKLVKTGDAEKDLPASYGDIKMWYADFFDSYCERGMEELLSANSGDFFPAGPNSAQALNSCVYSTFPQVFLQDSDNNHWFSTNLKTQSSSLPKNGRVSWAQLYDKSEVWLMSLIHSDDVPAGRFMDDPEYLGEFLLQGINIKRKLTSSDPGSRILSYGAPVETSRHVDIHGREWRINVWLLEFEDRVIISFSLPTPRGAAMLYVSTNSGERKSWIYDLKRLTDLTNVSYAGDMLEWTAFLARPEFLNGPVSKIGFEYEAGKRATVRTGDYRVAFDQGMIPIEDKNLLAVYYDSFVKKGSPVRDVRRVVYDDGGEGKNYFMLSCYPEPDPILPKATLDSWETMILKQGHPYVNKAFADNGNTRIARIHPDYVKDGTVKPIDGCVYASVVGKPGSVADDEMARLMDAFAANSVSVE